MTNNRIDLISDFLKSAAVENFHIQKIAGDASFRSYFRASLDNGKSFIIMDAPPEFEDIKPFCKIAEFLLQNNFSAPQIYAKDYQNGFLLLEDLGDDTYARVLSKFSGDELKKSENNLYQKAIDLLIDLHKISNPQVLPKDLPLYDQELLLREVMLFADWYLPHIVKKPLNEEQLQKFKKLWLDLFQKLSQPEILVLRDYHAENLMVINSETHKSKSISQAYDQVGLLDFQDAVIGSKAYDLVSLLEDARRDVAKELQEKMIQYYLQNSGCDREVFLRDYAILSLQRNVKIIGIFARLAIRDKKTNYLNFLPRVFGYVNSRLHDDSFKEIKNFLLNSNS